MIQLWLAFELVRAVSTSRNPSVCYELAARHSTGKPTIHLIELGEPIPFDVAAMRAIQFDTRDLDSVENCKTELRNQITSIEQNPSTESPLSQTINIQQLRQSGQPVETAIADITVALGALSTELQGVRSQLSTLVLAQVSSASPRISSFSCSGSGTYTHGL